MSHDDSSLTDEERDELRRKWRDMLDRVKVSPEYAMDQFEREYLPGLIQSATVPADGRKATSTKAARELCAAGAYCFEHGIPMPPALQDYLVTALKSGADGGSIDAALHLKRGPGQAKSGDPMDVAERERRFAVRLFGLVFFSGLPEPRAKEKVCEEFGIDTRRVEQIWKKYKPTPEGIAGLRQWQEAMKALMARKPADTSSDAYREWLDEVMRLTLRLP